MSENHIPVELDNLVPKEPVVTLTAKAAGTRIPIASSSNLRPRNSSMNIHRQYLEDRTNSLINRQPQQPLSSASSGTFSSVDCTTLKGSGRMSRASSHSDESTNTVASTESENTRFRNNTGNNMVNSSVSVSKGTGTMATTSMSMLPPPPSTRVKPIGKITTRGRSLANLTAKTSSMPRISKSLDRKRPEGDSGRLNLFEKNASSTSDSESNSSKVEELESYLRSEVYRLRTDASEWELEKRKLEDSVSDLQEKLASHRENSYNREESYRKTLSEREQLIFDLKSSQQDSEHEIQERIENSKAELRIAHIQELKDQNSRVESEISRLQSAAEQERDRLIESHNQELQSLRLRLESQLSAQQAKAETEQERLRVNYQQQLHEYRMTIDPQLSAAKQAESEFQERFSQQTLHFEQLSLLQKDRLSQSEKELELVRRELDEYKDKYNNQKHETESLRASISELTTSSVSLESATRAQEQRIVELQLQLSNQQEKSAGMHTQLQAALQERDVAEHKLLKEELIRRKLHNQIQELKGNIRVYCRVRPSLSKQEQIAHIAFPDLDEEGQKLCLTSYRSDTPTGSPTTTIHPFNFDKVFSPSCSNREIFDEISQLVQSALDGYNVCIFAYGQTGSGKTYTMSSNDGMIPRAMIQIFDTTNNLKEKGWKYQFEGQFLEIYNETINDLLGSPGNIDKSKLEIKHDKNKTVVVGLTTVPLDSPDCVSAVLKQASTNRSVAATKMNERSSRSHSVFTVRITGHNSITNHSCEGLLNLIDLAGSERLSQSQATGDRLKETQAINKSLSSLGDVIYALGNSKDGSHIPYRNSKLTYLLQNSLSGDSKTLMFVNVSPLEVHLNETLSSLRFATKVNNTQISKKSSGLK